jgi:hypothetical protein
MLKLVHLNYVCTFTLQNFVPSMKQDTQYETTYPGTKFQISECYIDRNRPLETTTHFFN